MKKEKEKIKKEKKERRHSDIHVHSNREKSEQERGTTEKGCFLSPIIHYLQSRALLLARYVLACVSSPFFIKLLEDQSGACARGRNLLIIPPP